MPSKQFDFVIFDLDGTLIDAFEDITLAANFVRQRNHLPDLTIDQVKKHVGHGARYLVEGVLDSTDTGFIDDNLAALVTFYENLNDSTAKVYDGVIDTLDALHSAGVRTAVASNKPHTVSVRVVEELGLKPYFDNVRGEAADIRRKPAPDVLLRLMQDADMTPGRTLMVGDTEIDIQAAHAAGAKVAAVTYGQHTAEHLRKYNPDFLLGAMSDLIPVVLQTN